MTTLVGKNCDGGHYICSPPKECCKQGCCFLVTHAVSRSPQIPPGNIFNPLFLGHWYFWLALTATVAGILCACSLWKRHSQGYFCSSSSNSERNDRASIRASNGSFYAPPQYSRCNSFYQQPPPYSEVTSKPDLYPIVISYNGDPIIKNNSTGYLMVQYLRNFIVRPAGTISATSTFDSLSSSFMCNTANEANTIVPPPYSCTSSLEEVTQGIDYDPPASTSVTSEGVYRPVQSPGRNETPSRNSSRKSIPPRPHSAILIRDNPCFLNSSINSTSITANSIDNISRNGKQISFDRPTFAKSNEIKNNSAESPINTKSISNRLPKEISQESEEEPNFSELLNLSVCNAAPPPDIGVIGNHHIGALSSAHPLFSVTNSMTGSDISSLANLDTPDSPPRATSPTAEMRELLDKIQQLPQHKSPVPPQEAPAVPQQQIRENVNNKNRSYFHRLKAKTLYIPLAQEQSNFQAINKTKAFSRNWLSRSAPNTPCGTFAPTFPMHKKNIRLKMEDGSPLLNEEESEEESCTRLMVS